MLSDNRNGQALPAEAGIDCSRTRQGLEPTGRMGDYHKSIASLSRSNGWNRFCEIRRVSLFRNRLSGLHYCQKKASEAVSGWVSCSGYMFPYKSLPLDDKVSVIMPDREPRRFASAVKVLFKEQQNHLRHHLGNTPLTVDGWKIYQTGYDETMGKWSESSIFEIVRDPWLPCVYIGIFMLIARAAYTCS